MKAFRFLFFFFLTIFAFQTTEASKGVLTESPSYTKATPTAKQNRKQTYTMMRRNLEQQLGRKLRFMERMGLRAYAWLPEKQQEDARKANNQAIAGFVLGLCSLLVLPLLAIPGFIISNSALTKEKLNPGILEGSNKGLAKAGQILSIIGFVYLLLLFLYILLVLSVGIYV